MKKCSVTDCEQKSSARGLCQKHYIRARKYGSPHATHERYMRGRRWLESNSTFALDDCLRWPFSVGNHGRGSVQVNGKTMSAPRYMCMLAHGRPPTPGHHAAHTCGKGHEGCVNPNHLRWAKPSENEADKIKHGTIRRGTKVNTNKLTEHDVRCIRRSLQDGAQGAKIAKAYGVTPAMVSRIKKRQAWDWLD